MKPPRPTTNIVPTSRAWGCDGTPPKSGRPMKLQKTCLPAERLRVWVPGSLGGRQVVARGWAARALGPGRGVRQVAAAVGDCCPPPHAASGATRSPVRRKR